MLPWHASETNAERLDTAIDEIIASTRIQNALGVFSVAELEGKPDASLLARKNVGRTTIDALNQALREKLSLERTPEGRLRDCNGTSRTGSSRSRGTATGE